MEQTELDATDKTRMDTETLDNVEHIGSINDSLDKTIILDEGTKAKCKTQQRLM